MGENIREMKDSNQARMNIGLGLAVLIFSIMNGIFYQRTPESTETWISNLIFWVMGGAGLAILAGLLLLLNREIKEYKRTVAGLRRRGFFLEAIVDNIPYMIFVKEAGELRYVSLNKAGESLLGYSKEELTGKNDYDFFLKEEANFFTAKDRKVFEERTLVEIPAEPIHTRYNGTRILHTKKVPIYDEQGKPLYLLGISEDITDRR
jgi:PAS domain S-box-containing protein